MIVLVYLMINWQLSNSLVTNENFDGEDISGLLCEEIFLLRKLTCTLIS